MTDGGKKKVSVIVPVYNTEKELERCICSIRNQTYRDLDILLVDDGSTDTSPVLCDRAAKEDERIRVIHKENGGVSSARNEGITQAKGDFVVFVDSDDWIEDRMIEKMADAAEKYQASLVVCGYRRALENVSEDNAETAGEKEQEILCSAKEVLNFYLLEDEKIRIPHSVWGKLFTRELIGTKRFPLIKRTEELLFSTEIFCELNRCVYLKEAFYHYCDDRETSLMHQTDAGHTVEREIPLLIEQIRVIEQNGFSEEAELAYFCFGKRLLYFYLEFRDKMLRKEALYVKKYAKENRKRILKSLKGDFVKKTDRLRMILFVWFPAVYYCFVLLHDRREV